jgi:hypothetical protein
MIPGRCFGSGLFLLTAPISATVAISSRAFVSFLIRSDRAGCAVGRVQEQAVSGLCKIVRRSHVGKGARHQWNFRTSY